MRREGSARLSSDVTSKHRLRDAALYVVIALCLVGFVGTLALWLPEKDVPSRAWFVFVVATAFLFFFIGKMYWHKRRSPRVWLLLAAVLVVHVVGYSVLLSYLPNFPDALFLVLVPLEVMLIALIVKLCLKVMPQSVKL